MTTPTTPAADAVSAIQALIDDEAQYLCVVVAKTHLALLLSEIAAATARESALIAERDALLIAGGDLANCAYNLAQRSGEVLSARSAVALDNARRKWDAALSAPAVEGGCDGHKKIRDSATTLDAELASLNALRYNRTL